MKSPGHVSNVTMRSFAFAFDRFDVTVERIPMKFLRFFGLLLNQMELKDDFAPGAICMLLCCNQTWLI